MSHLRRVLTGILLLMGNDPAFLFYPGDYLRDTQTLSERAQVAYDRIICEHMRKICITQAQLDFFTKRLTADEKMELLMVLSKVSGGFQIAWVAESIAKRREYSDSRRKNREGKKQKISSSYVNHMENENENENEDIIENWKRWGKSILDENDPGWDKMFGRKITQDELDQFYSIATRNEWIMDTQQKFRFTLHGFKLAGKSNGQPKESIAERQHREREAKFRKT